MKQSNKCTGGCATPPPTIGLSNWAPPDDQGMQDDQNDDSQHLGCPFAANISRLVEGDTGTNFACDIPIHLRGQYYLASCNVCVGMCKSFLCPTADETILRSLRGMTFEPMRNAYCYEQPTS